MTEKTTRDIVMDENKVRSLQTQLVTLASQRNTKAVSIKASLLIAGIIGFIWYMMTQVGQNPNAEKIRVEGLAGQARIIKLKDTKTAVMEDRVIEIQMEVTGENGEVFPKTIKQRVSIVNLPAIQPNTVHKVKYDPTNYEVVFAEEIF